MIRDYRGPGQKLEKLLWFPESQIGLLHLPRGECSLCRAILMDPLPFVFHMRFMFSMSSPYKYAARPSSLPDSVSCHQQTGHPAS